MDGRAATNIPEIPSPASNHRNRPLLSDWGGGGGSFWGCLRTGQATHPPKLTHPPTHPDPPPTPPVGGGGLFHPASYVHCILKILTKGQRPKFQNCKDLGLNPRTRSCSAVYSPLDRQLSQQHTTQVLFRSCHLFFHQKKCLCTWSILATRIVWESQALPSPYPVAHPPTQTPSPPPWGGVGTLGQIAQNQTNPPTHRPRTPPPPQSSGTTLKQRSAQEHLIFRDHQQKTNSSTTSILTFSVAQLATRQGPSDTPATGPPVRESAWLQLPPGPKRKHTSQLRSRTPVSGGPQLRPYQWVPRRPRGKPVPQASEGARVEPAAPPLGAAASR